MRRNKLFASIKNYKSKIVSFLLPLPFLIFILLCSRFAGFAEWYMVNCYPPIAAVLSFFSRLFPFSMFDFMIITAIIALVGSIVMMFLKRLSFRCWSKFLFLSVLWLVVWFYMSWGIGYFRPHFFERFGVEPPKEDREFFEALVIRYIDSLNRAYVAEPYFFDAKDVFKEIDALYVEHHDFLRLPYVHGWRRPKYTVIEPLMTKMGIAGFFAPFFNEVKVNNFALPTTYPYTLAHEKAHRLGIACEAECNLYATVICTSSSHPLVRYSGYLQTTSYLLGNLRKISPERYREIFDMIDPRVIADFRAIRKHWETALNPTLSAVQDKVYDTYLKTNKQASGILSYSEVTGLIVAWEGMRSEE